MSIHQITTGILALFLLTAMSGMDANAEDQTKLDDVIAALIKSDVSVLGLAMKTENGGPQIALGTGPTGDKDNSASDENLALPEPTLHREANPQRRLTHHHFVPLRVKHFKIQSCRGWSVQKRP